MRPTAVSRRPSLAVDGHEEVSAKRRRGNSVCSKLKRRLLKKENEIQLGDYTFCIPIFSRFAVGNNECNFLKNLRYRLMPKMKKFKCSRYHIQKHIMYIRSGAGNFFLPPSTLDHHYLCLSGHKYMSNLLIQS